MNDSIDKLTVFYDEMYRGKEGKFYSIKFTAEDVTAFLCFIYDKKVKGWMVGIVGEWGAEKLRLLVEEGKKIEEDGKHRVYFNSGIMDQMMMEITISDEHIMEEFVMRLLLGVQDAVNKREIVLLDTNDDFAKVLEYIRKTNERDDNQGRM